MDMLDRLVRSCFGSFWSFGKEDGGDSKYIVSTPTRKWKYNDNDHTITKEATLSDLQQLSDDGPSQIYGNMKLQLHDVVLDQVGDELPVRRDINRNEIIGEITPHIAQIVVIEKKYTTEESYEDMSEDRSDYYNREHEEEYGLRNKHLPFDELSQKDLSKNEACENENFISDEEGNDDEGKENSEYISTQESKDGSQITPVEEEKRETGREDVPTKDDHNLNVECSCETTEEIEKSSKDLNTSGLQLESDELVENTIITCNDESQVDHLNSTMLEDVINLDSDLPQPVVSVDETINESSEVLTSSTDLDNDQVKDCNETKAQVTEEVAYSSAGNEDEHMCKSQNDYKDDEIKESGNIPELQYNVQIDVLEEYVIDENCSSDDDGKDILNSIDKNGNGYTVDEDLNTNDSGPFS